QMVVELFDGALATSGNYRNYYIHQGKKYAHTINPVTGYPVQTEILSASVYAPACMEADAYATGLMVVGVEKAKEIIRSHPDLEGCLIYESDGKFEIWMSDGLKKWIVP
ncbi:MAG: FAD:protein FMN transferase, partial [Odoribacter sp.]|nr:FAD:protein FMN transferase [Odoribacter sp.]